MEEKNQELVMKPYLLWTQKNSYKQQAMLVEEQKFERGTPEYFHLFERNLTDLTGRAVAREISFKKVFDYPDSYLKMGTSTGEDNGK